jgi:hypothetical protein
MAACAQRLLEDPGLARSLIADARGWAIEHGWDAARARWLELYRELAGTR